MTPAQSPRMYADVASWWPLLSPPEEYDDEGRYLRSILDSTRDGVVDVLDLGSGGGHLASRLGGGLDLCLVDVSEPMLDVSRALNPAATHIVGDMREVRLGRAFDAVILHDAVDYMTTEGDLRAAMETAWVHLRPGGVAVLLPDHVRETYRAGTAHGGSDGVDGRGARFLEWTWDQDPTDTTVVTQYVMTLRGRDGSVSVVHDEHMTGLFPVATWLRLLEDAGFDPVSAVEPEEDGVAPEVYFVARRP